MSVLQGKSCLQCWLALALVVLARCASSGEVPVRLDLPDASATSALPISGGIPFPQGALDSAEHARLLSGDKELPCQIVSTATWPDGSVKWIFIDTVMAPGAAKDLKVEFGANVKRQAIAQPLLAEQTADGIKLSGGGIDATLRKNGGGFIDTLAMNGKPVIDVEHAAKIVIDAVRIPEGDSGQALPGNTYVVRDPKAVLDHGKVEITELAIESPGPIRATVRIRGNVLLPHFGETLPDAIKQHEPAGKIPFSMRVNFYAGSTIVFAQHQIIFSGEPDCDFISHWALELPGKAGAHGTLDVEPGVEMEQRDGKLSVAAAQTRLCWAPLKSGFALIRKGWENRPSGIMQSNDGSAWLDFWPREAGLFDLRRYSREWGVGESGNVKSLPDAQRFSKLAARGLAKSHDFVIDFSDAKVDGAATPLVKSLAERALLIAPPGWYSASQVLGNFAPEQTTGDFAPIDSAVRRQLDWRLFNQDLFNWYGKLTYGFWQYRYGEMHRTDRWENDYGRWGWSLADGAGRIGHVLMLEFLRTNERRYFDAGEAFSRISYDTNMLHCQQYYENAGTGFWTVPGCSHRHNVQPFGCPYVGMRGSYPAGQRILYFLTNDGVIADGIQLVADAGVASSEGNGSRQGNSGDDGIGPCVTALLWKFETTGDKKYLGACRKLLDSSNIFPPKNVDSLGYAPAFGIFTTALEYAELSKDTEFQQHCVATAQAAAKAKEPAALILPIATGYYYSKDAALKTLVESLLKKTEQQEQNGIEFLPPEQWPGHGGARTSHFDPNGLRDSLYAAGLLANAEANVAWPKLTPSLRAVPASAPADWYRAGGKIDKFQDAAQPPEEISPELAKLLKDLEHSPLAGHLSPVIQILDFKESPDGAPVPFKQFSSEGGGDGTIKGVITDKAGPAAFTLKMSYPTFEKSSAMRITANVQLPKGAGRIASWGFQIPLKLSGNANAIETTAPGRFRLERCRLDQNDERIPSWLSSEERMGKDYPLWPKWRVSGAQFGPGDSYRLWRAVGTDVTPVVCDQGEGAPFWFDITDRGGKQPWGLTVRLLKPAGDTTAQQSVRVNLETGMLEIQFHDSAAAPLEGNEASGAVDLIFHDGWRPPLSNPELTKEQYEKFIDDLGYGENYGLMALRFCISATHKVTGRQWMEKIRDLGIEPREILYTMQYNNALAEHCKKIGVTVDPNNLEATVKTVIEHYKK